MIFLILICFFYFDHVKGSCDLQKHTKETIYYKGLYNFRLNNLKNKPEKLNNAFKIGQVHLCANTFQNSLLFCQFSLKICIVCLFATI